MKKKKKVYAGDPFRIRKDIFTALKSFQRSKKVLYVSSYQLRDWFLERYTRVPSLHQIGNNLRILMRSGIVGKHRIQGYGYWCLTGKKHVEEALMPFLLRTPRSLHERCVKVSRARGISMNAFLCSLVESGVSRLERRRT